ncbi:hypothetical protein [Aphanizomenon sp. UHCC 0183]|uniref:hypothetical protein n=1 Tax=Aphanizomenon sp. UHCC 0183 TaxID=2590028 RepID=UPI0014481B91|nr:hypothetical protein [Aphanizomenon sp. UHCC 0183]
MRSFKIGVVVCDSEALRRNRLKLGGCERSPLGMLGCDRLKLGGCERSLFGDVGER